MSIPAGALKKSIKSGIICGVLPGITLLLLLLTIIPALNFLLKPIIIIFFIVGSLAIVVSVILTLGNIEKQLSNLIEIMLLSGISGFFYAITFGIITWIPIVIWMLYSLKNGHWGDFIYFRAIEIMLISVVLITFYCLIFSIGAVIIGIILTIVSPLIKRPLSY